MPILQITTLAPPGLQGVLPQIVYINTTDTVATVTAAGYLSTEQVKEQGYLFTNNQMALVGTKTAPGAATVVGFYSVSVAATGIVTLNAASSGVTLPVAVGHIATFSNIAGGIQDSANPATNLGDINAGASGTAGVLRSFPAAALSGALILDGVANAGNFAVIISNASYGQSSTVSFADVGNAFGRFLVGATNTPLVNGNLVQANGTGGLVVDSTIARTNVQLKTQVHAGISGNIGGAGVGPLAVAVAGAVVGSPVVVQIASSSNACSVIAAISTVTGFNVTVSADPGANLVVDYVLYIAAQ